MIHIFVTFWIWELKMSNLMYVTFIRYIRCMAPVEGLVYCK